MYCTYKASYIHVHSRYRLVNIPPINLLIRKIHDEHKLTLRFLVLKFSVICILIICIMSSTYKLQLIKLVLYTFF